MGILLAFAPFAVFAVFDRMFGATEGLIAGAVVSAVLLVRDWVGHHRAPKVLEVGTMILFGGLGLYAVMAGPSWSIIGVRLRVDAGLLLIVLVSMVVGLAFAVMVGADVVMLYRLEVPSSVGVTATILAIVGAFKFTDWYPKRRSAAAVR